MAADLLWCVFGAHPGLPEDAERWGSAFVGVSDSERLPEADRLNFNDMNAMRGFLGGNRRSFDRVAVDWSTVKFMQHLRARPPQGSLLAFVWAACRHDAVVAWDTGISGFAGIHHGSPPDFNPDLWLSMPPIIPPDPTAFLPAYRAHNAAILAAYFAPLHADGRLVSMEEAGLPPRVTASPATYFLGRPLRLDELAPDLRPTCARLLSGATR